jgi:N6-adenosine-specific RNA methylase IME4
MKDLITLPSYNNPTSIEEAKINIVDLGHNMNEHAYLVGENLLYVKGQLNHGQFEVWIERNLWFKPRTARYFMAYAEKCDEKQLLLKEPHYLERGKTANFADLSRPELPEGTFNVIYADPPWQYSNSGFDESAQQHYPTMTNEELYDMAEKLNPVIAEPAVLFLWVTNPFLWVGLQLCEAWSFDYKTNFAWIKNKGPSMGWFNLARHELLFIATRGEGMHPVERPNSWFEGEVTKHSKKPEAIYEMIEKMYPNQKYLELFARNTRQGWTSWGNEIS